MAAQPIIVGSRASGPWLTLFAAAGGALQLQPAGARRSTYLGTMPGLLGSGVARRKAVTVRVASLTCCLTTPLGARRGARHRDPAVPLEASQGAVAHTVRVAVTTQSSFYDKPSQQLPCSMGLNVIVVRNRMQSCVIGFGSNAQFVRAKVGLGQSQVRHSTHLSVSLSQCFRVRVSSSFRGKVRQLTRPLMSCLAWPG